MALDHPSHDISIPELRANLARQGKRMWQAAAHVGVGPSTLTEYLNGRLRSPPSLRMKLERFLDLKPGTLRDEHPTGT